MIASIPPAADRANDQMVDRLIADGSLYSPTLMAAFRATPRHRFLRRIFQYHRKRERWRPVRLDELSDRDLETIYSDRALITRVSTPDRSGPGVPISSSSQPSLMAQMLEDLQLAAGQRVLEIGAGTGYNAALLAHVANPGPVISVDVDRDALLEAWEHLRSFADRVVTFRHADGREGFSAGAPFDRIMVTAAAADLEPAWLEQLTDGGLLLVPLALAPGLAFIARGTVGEGEFHGRLVRAAYFMPLRSEGEAGEREERPWPQPGELLSVPAPWEGWFDRKRPGSWLGFIQALVFYGLIKKLAVRHRSSPGGEAMYGVSDGGTICWFGTHTWQTDSDAGQELGLALWRSFLDAGGPRPTDFTLRAIPLHRANIHAAKGVVRRGARCLQFWEQVDPTERGPQPG